MLRVLPTTIELHDLDKLVLRFTRNMDICFHVIMNSSDPILVYVLVLRMVMVAIATRKRCRFIFALFPSIFHQLDKY